ncbi:HlyC/CorC family transporter [Clostridium botulinum]|uniref:hemolysin family protein n=1 Tax=Clostridium botulinum TaxID=1491 RepID=UPI00174BBD04|nr:hemolysin family protein [Clostridium botulinum]MBD5644510.1 HlyC/CorC family transporter [Clostridium botulinum]
MELEPDPANITSQLMLIFILTLLNAFFASAEMAIVSLNKNKIKLLSEEGNKKAKLLVKLMDEPTKFLSTIQVGITLAGFFSSASAATGISEDLAQYLSQLNIPYSRQIALVTVTIILSYITLVFGELFPKRIALQKSETIALFSVRPILYVSKITVPFVKLLSASTNILVRLVGLDNEGLDEKVSKEEIKSLVEVGQENGVINEKEKEMINSIFEFDDKLADEVMTPRTEVYLIDIEKPLKEYLDELIEERYSRIPVYEGSIDNIIGILYMKDFLGEARKHGFENVDIRSILHPAYFVPETKNIDDLFKELQAFKKHMAILIDEYGGFSGIVSIEDLIEEVMGNIEDEYDEDEPAIKKIDNDIFIIDGMVSIDDFNDYFNIDIESQDYDTINGFLIDLLGHIPMSAEEKNIEYKNFIFKIEEIKEKRIKKIKFYVQKEV